MCSPRLTPIRRRCSMSLQQEMQERLASILGTVCGSLVCEAIAEQLSDVTATWLVELSSDEVFDSQGEHALRRAANLARDERQQLCG